MLGAFVARVCCCFALTVLLKTFDDDGAQLLAQQLFDFRAQAAEEFVDDDVDLLVAHGLASGLAVK